MQERLPFDPSRIRRPAEKPAGPRLLSVRQVNELVRGTLARHIPATLHVLGEIGDFSRPASGHVYFTLKDADSELRCVLWRSTALQLKFAPEMGMEVIATGGLEVYAPRGTYQLVVRKLEPRGVGALEVAFRQLKERLEREGLFDPQRKCPLPRIPERVAVVTSPTGAALRDILQTLRRRLPLIQVLVFPVRVQGEGAAEEIAAAIRALNEHAEVLGGVDLAIVGRGGGSLEDLWAFNEEVVARAIAASRIPIVSAVGHEVDVTISDLVADLRAPTPTAAAELIAPSGAELTASVERQAQRSTRALTHMLQLARAALTTALAHEPLARPLARLRERSQLVDEILHRLETASARAFRQAREQLTRAEFTLLRFRTGARFAPAARHLEQLLHRLTWALNARAVGAERGLAHAAARLARRSPAARLSGSDEHLRLVCTRLVTALRLVFLHRRRLLAARVQAVAACDPRAVLRRGYSITRAARTREIIRSVDQIRDRLRIITELADGEFPATAEDPRQPPLFE